MNNEGRVNIHLLNERIPPHERTFLYELSEERKREFVRLPSAERSEVVRDSDLAEPSVTRVFGAIPRENRAFREYMANMGSIARQLLNEALIERGSGVEREDSEQTGNRLSITEARPLLPESRQREIRLRARNLAWQSLVPEEMFDRNPLPEAQRISDTVAHIQDHLQERASVAQTARNDFVAERIRPREIALEAKKDTPSFQVTPERREQFARSALDSFNPAEQRRIAELDLYAAQTREDVYRAFELLDVQRRDFDLARAHNDEQVQKGDILDRITQFRPEMGKAAEAVKLRSPFHQQLSFSTAQIQSEHTAEQVKESSSGSLSMYVPSDREWHFDNLREVFDVELSRPQNRDRGREIELYQKVDDVTRDH